MEQRLNSKAKTKKQFKPADRVSLTTLNVQRLDKWLSQVQMTLPDFKLNKTDLVNWMLKSHGETLSDRELAAIQREYFDPVKALESAILQAKKRQVLGEDFDLRMLVNEKLMIRRRNLSKKKLRSNNSEPPKLNTENIALD